MNWSQFCRKCNRYKGIIHESQICADCRAKIEPDDTRMTEEQWRDLRQAQDRAQAASDKAAESLAKFGATLKPISESLRAAISPWAKFARYALQLEVEQHERDKRREVGL